MKKHNLTTLLLLALISFSCNGQAKKDTKSAPSSTTSASVVGKRIDGDFDGDKIIESAFCNKIKDESGNPMEDGESAEYEVKFSSDKLKSLNVGCCEFILVNEGDLNGDGKDEFSIFQNNMNGCAIEVRVLTYSKNKWKDLIEPFLISLGCGVKITNSEYQKWIVSENKTIYYLEPDINDENLLNEDGTRINFERLKKTKAQQK